nr:immunoglobulin heavy chain junction region [Macaca mulatta]MOV90945.1 immunoglobulin heavy chain junction region [Macaca mulatta]
CATEPVAFSAVRGEYYFDSW